VVGKIFRIVSKVYWNLVYKEIRKTYEIPDSFRLNGKYIALYGDGLILCGSGYIGNFSTIQSMSPHKVVIGQNVSISHNVRFYTTSVTTHSFTDYNGTEAVKGGNILIGNNVWIGANVVVIGPVSVCDGVVIGANSVLSRDIIESGVYAGSPLRKIR
jgi:acetyltransferase-like isoleucine patch superfamily enzyme